MAPIETRIFCVALVTLGMLKYPKVFWQKRESNALCAVAWIFDANNWYPLTHAWKVPRVFACVIFTFIPGPLSHVWSFAVHDVSHLTLPRSKLENIIGRERWNAWMLSPFPVICILETVYWSSCYLLLCNLPTVLRWCSWRVRQVPSTLCSVKLFNCKHTAVVSFLSSSWIARECTMYLRQQTGGSQVLNWNLLYYRIDGLTAIQVRNLAFVHQRLHRFGLEKSPTFESFLFSGIWSRTIDSSLQSILPRQETSVHVSVDLPSFSCSLVCTTQNSIMFFVRWWTRIRIDVTTVLLPTDGGGSRQNWGRYGIGFQPEGF